MSTCPPFFHQGYELLDLAEFSEFFRPQVRPSANRTVQAYLFQARLCHTGYAVKPAHAVRAPVVPVGHLFRLLEGPAQAFDQWCAP